MQKPSVGEGQKRKCIVHCHAPRTGRPAPSGSDHPAMAGLGGSNPPALQWHGLPFPHPQATKLKSSEARQGLSGWFSHTQPVPLQVGQCWIDFAWPSTVSSGFWRSSIGVRSNALSAAFRERPSRSRSDSSLPSISAPLSRLSPGRLRGVPFKPGCLGVAMFKFLACQLRQRVIGCDVPSAPEPAFVMLASATMSAHVGSFSVGGTIN